MTFQKAIEPVFPSHSIVVPARWKCLVVCICKLKRQSCDSLWIHRKANSACFKGMLDKFIFFSWCEYLSCFEFCVICFEMLHINFLLDKTPDSFPCNAKWLCCCTYCPSASTACLTVFSSTCLRFVFALYVLTMTASVSEKIKISPISLHRPESQLSHSTAAMSMTTQGKKKKIHQQEHPLPKRHCW